MIKKVLFHSFYNDFDCFRPCEGMRKHAFAGRNTQHTMLLNFSDGTRTGVFNVVLHFLTFFALKMLKKHILTSVWMVTPNASQYIQQLSCHNFA